MNKLEELKRLYKEQIKQIDECPYYPEYSSIFQPCKSKVELRQKALSNFQEMLQYVI